MSPALDVQERTVDVTARADLTGWTLALVDPARAPEALAARLARGIPITVPGSVLGALVEHGLARDVSVDGTEEEVAWVAACTWVMRCRVPRRADGARVRLVLEGVDTFATVRVDGVPVLATDDMFHRWELDLGVDDEAGAWELEVELAPALPIARSHEAERALPRAALYDLPFNQVRKMACSFGWDWGPVTVTAGLWRRATVERIPAARLATVRLDAQWRHGVGAVLEAAIAVDGPHARVAIAVVDRATEATLAAGTARDGRLRLEVPDALRWEVAGRGDQPLYAVVVEALDEAGAVVDRAERTVGFRDLRLVQEPDAWGRSFAFEVNGSRVWARGFNWIPADVLPERVARDHVRRLVRRAVDAGAVMLRVWGGGVIESDDFYDACDELGVLVWQDFAFACACYPEDDVQAARVRREVADAVDRIGHRASLAVWCGCNENLWGWEEWGWQDQLGADEPWGERLYRDVIPTALAALDPARPYVPGSPFSEIAGRPALDPGSGTTHHWDTWNREDYSAFEDMPTRFAAEFGWQGPPSWRTLVTAIGGEPSGAADPRLDRLQKAGDGAASLARGVAAHLAHLPQDGPGWHLAAQLVQARALRAAIGAFRARHDECSGALWWQLDDCWPGISWSVVDVRGRAKLAWHAAREVMAARAALPAAPGRPGAVTLVNDTASPWTVAGALRVIDESGAVLRARPLHAVVPADGHVVVAPGAVPEGAVAVVVDADGLRAVRWLVPDDALGHPEAEVVVVGIERGEGEAVVTVEARTMVRDLVLRTELHEGLADAEVDRQLMLLLPGERARLSVRGEGVEALSHGDWTELLAAGTALRTVLEH